MDVIYLKITHMEKEKYVTANDFYPVNISMLYGVNSENLMILVCLVILNSNVLY